VIVRISMVCITGAHWADWSLMADSHDAQLADYSLVSGICLRELRFKLV